MSQTRGRHRGGCGKSGQLSDATNNIILGVDSRGISWDILTGRYGPDIAFIDQALDWAFARCTVDPARLAIGGFSDAPRTGCRSAWRMVTCSATSSPSHPGSWAVIGKPRIFVSHGTQDRVLEIDSTSRSLVPQLQRAGYQVRYREFAGPHTVPQEVAREALEWFNGDHPA